MRRITFLIPYKHVCSVEHVDLARSQPDSAIGRKLNPLRHSSQPHQLAQPAHNPSALSEKRPFMRKAATTCEVVQLPQVPPRGAELSDDSPGNRPVSKAGGTPCGTVGDVDLQLVAVIQAWAELPESVKTAVMEMVRG